MAKALVVVGLLVAACSAFYRAPEFTLNLDLPPNKRWAGAPTLIVNTHGWENSFGPVIAQYQPLSLLLPSTISQALIRHVKKTFPTTYQELKGISAEVAALGHPEANLTLFIPMLYFYELAHATDLRDKISSQFARSCTGILALPRDHSKEIIHGRNMDESPAAGRNTTLHITAIRNNQTVYEAFDWTWITGGFLTSSRFDGVTTEENWRDYGNHTMVEIFQRIMTPGTIPTQLIQRVVQENATRFEDAVEYFRTVQLAAPVYIIMSGTGRRGAVLSLYFNSSENVVELINDDSDSWFMVQTNYDRWLPDPPTDPRRTVAENALRAIGQDQGGSQLGVWMAISTFPVHNSGTMYTVIMSAMEPIFGFVRDIIHGAGY